MAPNRLSIFKTYFLAPFLQMVTYLKLTPTSFIDSTLHISRRKEGNNNPLFGNLKLIVDNLASQNREKGKIQEKWKLEKTQV